MADDPANQNALQMRFLIQWVAGVKDGVHRALGMAMVEATELAYKDAVGRAKTQFNNTPGRVRTGGLMNAISRGFNPTTGKGFLQVESAYGAMQEFGGDVHPKNAKHLWVKQYVGVPSQFRRMTPREFITAKGSDPAHFKLFKGMAAWIPGAGYRRDSQGRFAKKGQRAKLVPLFFLVDHATIPARPYIRPAVDMAFAQLPALLQARLLTGGA